MLSAGTMYVGGDFRQVNGGICGFRASGSHKTVLDGKGKQNITFDSTSSYFNVLELTQPRSNYRFTPDSCWNTIIEAETTVFGTPDFVLPSDTTRIEEEAFEGTSMKIVYVPDSCTVIEKHAFRGSSIEQIRIPVGCELGEDVFEGCEGVEIFGTAGSPAQDYCDEHDNCEFYELN